MAPVPGCSMLFEQSLEVAPIVADAMKLEQLAHKHGVEYDGWGTYFEGDEEDFELDDDEE